MNVKRFRKAIGLTQQELAVAIGVSLNTIARYETSSRKPTAEIRARLSNLAYERGFPRYAKRFAPSPDADPYRQIRQLKATLSAVMLMLFDWSDGQLEDDLKDIAVRELGWDMRGGVTDFLCAIDSDADIEEGYEYDVGRESALELLHVPDKAENVM